MDSFTQLRLHHSRREILKSGVLALLPVAIPLAKYGLPARPTTDDRERWDRSLPDPLVG
jgi:hypothetical protein